MSAPVDDALAEAMRRAVSALEREEISYLLAGGYAAYARGGPPPNKDVDFLINADDIDRALGALQREGMRTERPTEQWLVKAWDGDVLIDLIFRASGLPDNEVVFNRADRLNVDGQMTNVMGLDDVMVTKLLSLDERALDYAPLVAIARSLREQIDWGELRDRTADSPYSGAFYALVEDLGLVAHERLHRHASRVRIS
jgi:Uncharacterised nucleotidyltransferase